MKLPWQLKVIDLSGFELEKWDGWMAVAPRSEEEKAELEKLINMPEVQRSFRRWIKRLSKNFHRRRKPNRPEGTVKYYSKLERIGVTPQGSLVAFESKFWTIDGQPNGGWFVYICPRANYKELKRDFETEQVRIRKEMESLGYQIEDLDRTAMRLPWIHRRPPVIDLSRFHVRPPDGEPWRILAPQSEEESDAIEAAINMPKVFKHFWEGFKASRQANREETAANREESGIEVYTVLSVLGVTPDGDLVAIKNQVSIVGGKLDTRWMIYICPPAHYKELDQAYRTEQAKMREDIRREFG